MSFADKMKEVSYCRGFIEFEATWIGRFKEELEKNPMVGSFDLPD